MVPLLGAVVACLLAFAKPAVATSATVAESSGPCGTSAIPPATFRHVIWVVFENKTYSSIIGSPSAPYINALAEQCGLATNFFAETHPSLPNYIAMTSGSTQGITDNLGPSSHLLDVESIFSQLGSDWRALQESMPSNCLQSNSGLYAVRHNPAAYYTNIDCATDDVPLDSTPDLSAAFTFVTPNLCNDMHDCTVETGDAWLSTFMEKVLASPEYEAGGTVVFITWDESNDDSQHIATLAVSPYTAAAHAAPFYDHYSLLRTTEELLGLETLGNASVASSMRSAFGLQRFYPRPRGATPVLVSLVPAYQQCTSGNRTHGPPLSEPSCNRSTQLSGQLTVGTPTNGNAAKAVGSVTLNAIKGTASTPADEADVKLTVSIKDVRNKADLSDYTGEVQVSAIRRITDKDNTPSPGVRGDATVQDLPFDANVPCATTSDTTIGSLCSLETTADTLVPGSVEEGMRSIWELGQVQVYDGGADGVASTTADNTLYMDQGIFVP
jgi:phosphatidylinositol-3-phosphatase